MLRPRKRILRKEIKEDPLVTIYVRVRKWLQKHMRELNIGITIFLIVIVVSVLMVRSKKNAELSAAANLGIAEQYYYAGDYQRAIAELGLVANTYSGTKAAGSAIFLLANSYYESQDYQLAKQNYQTYLDDYGQNPLFKASSLAGLAACAEMEKLYLQAATLYEKAGKEQPHLVLAPHYLKSAGICYMKAGDQQKAKETFQMILDRYPDSSVSQDVSFYLKSI